MLRSIEAPALTGGRFFSSSEPAAATGILRPFPAGPVVLIFQPDSSVLVAFAAFISMPKEAIPMSAENKLGAKVRQLRELRDFSLDQLAAQSQCHPDVLARIEAGELVPSLTPLMNIASYNFV